MKLRLTIFILFVPWLSWGQPNCPGGTQPGCNIQASICDASEVSDPFCFSITGTAFANGTFANAGCSTGMGGNHSYGFITLYINSSGVLNILINANTNNGFIDVAIFNIPEGVAPCTAVLNGANAIGCNYASQSGGCVQFGGTFPCGSSVPAPVVNAGDVIMIIAQNWSAGSGNTNFTLELSQNAGSAGAGLPDATIDITSKRLCLNDPPTQLTAVNNGGKWSGVPGLDSTGIINPLIAGVGNHTVQYTIGTGLCQASDTDIITIGSVKISDTIMEACVAGGTYTFSGTVDILVPPDLGDLIVINCKGDTLILDSAPFAQSSYPFSFSGLEADGMPCYIEAYFTDFPCSDKIPYVANECLSCEFTSSTIQMSNCLSDNTFEVFGTIDLYVPPHIENCHGQALIFDAPFSSSVSYSFPNQIPNGDSCFIYAYFTEDICTRTIDYVAHTTPIVSLTSTHPSICLGDSTTISASGGIHYLWDNNLDTNRVHIITPNATTLYTVKGYNAYDCFTVDTLTVGVHPLPVVDFSVSQDQECIPVRAVFTNLTAMSDIKDCVWTFDNKQTATSCDSVVQLYYHPGLFGASLKITSSHDCVAELRKDNLLAIAPLPQALFRALPSVYELSDPHVYFSNLSTGAYQYAWDFGINGDTSYAPDPFYTYPTEWEGEYVVTLIAFSEAGCSDTIQHSIRGEEGLIFFVPNSFTPQGDEHNEEFRPILTSGITPEHYLFSIYDRWGEIIFQTSDVSKGWDGQNRANSTSDQTYTWMLTLTMKQNNQRKIYTGHVNLIR